MSLAKEAFNLAGDKLLTLSARAQRRCQSAQRLQKVGNYESAREAMGDLWRRVGERPATEGLDRGAAAEVLLRAGVLTGWIGSAKQIEGAQELAKNLISESMAISEALQDQEKIAEALIEIAYCYWREGAFDEARVMLQEAQRRVEGTNRELMAIALLRRAIVERSAKRFNDALRIHTEAAPVFEQCDDHLLRAQFHSGFANVLNYLSAAEYREDYVDRALIEYTAASFHFEEAGHARYQACIENNLGFLFSTVGKFADAHQHLDRAQALFTTLKDSVYLAQVDDTRARVLLAEGRLAEAEKHVQSAVRTLERGDEQSLLAEALTTHGIALARLGQHETARATFQSAIEGAYQAGDPESAGQAALTIIEELGAHLSAADLTTTYERAADLLAKSQNLATLKRLGACARRVLFLSHAVPAPPDWTGFSFKDAVRRYEAQLIERALRDAGGVVTRAAQLLGFRHHQSLVSVLGNRHQSLLHARSPVIPRRRSIIRLRKPRTTSPVRAAKAARPVSILHVEDNEMVAEVVKDTLESAGYKMEACATGEDALNKLEAGAGYDLLLLDNGLPGISGIELARRARQLAHLQQASIIMLSADDCETEARCAGVDVFLHKPKDIAKLVETITYLVANKPVRV